MKQLKCLIVLVLSTLCAAGHAKIINCYMGSWANYRPGNGKFISSDIDAKLCTHVSYTFFGIQSTGEFTVLDPHLEINLGNIQKAIDLKRINPNLKVLAVVGGWNQGSAFYSQMAADANKRKTFITSALKFIQAHGFDGLDVDWEYPTQRGGMPQDKQNFVTLLKEIKETFQPLNLELGIAVGASETTAALAYDIPNIAKYVDFINVMTYDFAMAGDGKLGFNAPLKGQGKNNVQDSIKYWLSQGAPASKLILGLGFYGRTFQLANNQQTTPGSPATGNGQPGPFTREPGYFGYNEICTMESQWNVVFDDSTGCPYMYKGNQWVSYDNVKSIEMKMDFLNGQNLGGAMLWSIETDDFHGECGEKYPLLKAINRKMGNKVENQPNTTRRPTVTTAAPITNKPNAPSGAGCSQDGFYRNEIDCSRYYQCVAGVRYEFTCPDGLKFDTAASACNWPNLVQC